MSQQYREMLSQLEDDVAEAIDEAYIREGYVDEDGEASEDAMREAAYKVFIDHAVVTSKAGRSKQALTQGEFYSAVFPSGPGAGVRSPDLDEVQERALKKLSTTVWGLTQSKRSGHIQRLLEANETTLLLCRCTVYRHAEARLAVYATDNERLIMEDAVDKEIQGLVRRASSLRRDLSMIVERHPKLESAIGKQLGVELARVRAELTIGTDENSNGKRKELAAPSA